MKTEGFDASQLIIKRSLDMRYEGQSYELNVPYVDVDTNFVCQFHATHEQRFSYARPDATVEVVTLRLSAIGETEKPALTAESLADADPSDALIAQNDVIFDGEVYSTGFYQRESLQPGNRIEGPAIVTEFSATTVVPPNFFAVVDVYGNVIMEQE